MIGTDVKYRKDNATGGKDFEPLRHSAADAATTKDGNWKMEDGKTDFANRHEICASWENLE
jgi:hypothetical protein